MASAHEPAVYLCLYRQRRKGRCLLAAWGHEQMRGKTYTYQCLDLYTFVTAQDMTREFYENLLVTKSLKMSRPGRVLILERSPMCKEAGPAR